MIAGPSAAHPRTMTVTMTAEAATTVTTGATMATAAALAGPLSGGFAHHALAPRPAHPRFAPPAFQPVRGSRPLTPREHEIARLAAARWTDQEIADALFISVRTVESHLASVYRKLGVSSRRAIR